MTEKELKGVYSIITALWKQIKEYHDIDINDDERWEKLREDDLRIVEDSDFKNFATNMAAVTESFLEQISRRNGENNG